MRILSVLLIFAALVLSYGFGLVSLVAGIRKYYPKTFRTLAAELCEKQAARDAAQESRREL